MVKIKTKSSITARYAETDKMGIVHHSAYPIWFEIGRTDFIKKAGMPYSVMEEKGVMTPLTELNCKYYLPAYYEDELTVETWVSKITAARIVFEYSVKRDNDGKLLALGSTHHGFVSSKIFRPVSMKKEMPEIFEAIRNAIEG